MLSAKTPIEPSAGPQFEQGADTNRRFVGTSGWAYASWKPGFYPSDLASKQFLAYYGARLTSVEVNYTFTSALKPGQLQGWLDQTPAHFRFSFKAPQRITHFSRLVECAGLLKDFFKSLAPASKSGKLGVVLFQLPPNFKADLPRLKAFLAAPALHGAKAPRIAFEFRHASWLGEQTYALLRKRDAALCVADSELLTTPEVHTAATHACFRLRKPGGYTAPELTAIAARVRAAGDRDVYCYVKHEDEPTGALNAQTLLKRLQR